MWIVIYTHRRHGNITLMVEIMGFVVKSHFFPIMQQFRILIAAVPVFQRQRLCQTFCCQCMHESIRIICRIATCLPFDTDQLPLIRASAPFADSGNIQNLKASQMQYSAIRILQCIAPTVCLNSAVHLRKRMSGSINRADIQENVSIINGIQRYRFHNNICILRCHISAIRNGNQQNHLLFHSFFCQFPVFSHCFCRPGSLDVLLMQRQHCWKYNARVSDSAFGNQRYPLCHPNMVQFNVISLFLPISSFFGRQIAQESTNVFMEVFIHSIRQCIFCFNQRIDLSDPLRQLVYWQRTLPPVFGVPQFHIIIGKISIQLNHPFVTAFSCTEFIYCCR